MEWLPREHGEETQEVDLPQTIGRSSGNTKLRTAWMEKTGTLSWTARPTNLRWVKPMEDFSSEVFFMDMSSVIHIFAQIFEGNTQYDTPELRRFEETVAQYIRLYPERWSPGGIGMRVELLGCDLPGRTSCCFYFCDNNFFLPIVCCLQDSILYYFPHYTDLREDWTHLEEAHIRYAWESLEAACSKGRHCQIFFFVSLHLKDS